MGGSGHSERSARPRPLQDATPCLGLDLAARHGELRWIACVQPRPMNGIFVAVIVRNRTLASSGSPAMYSTASAT